MAVVYQSDELDHGDGRTEVTDSHWDFISEHSEPSTRAGASPAAEDDDTSPVTPGSTYSKSPRVQLYDSGATYHMSPDRERFVNYTPIAPRAISGANQE